MSNSRVKACLPFGSVACGVLALVTAGYLAACGGGDMMGPGDECSVGDVLGPGQQCSVGDNTFEVMPDGFGCLIEPDGISRECGNKDVTTGGFSASRIEDTMDWRIDSMP